ncbi:MAG: copper chaperone PCu(A)C [Ferrovum sp.]|jgi:copper(I)-binding protein/peroxiredoxin|nr:copper chaperone PCu(A)C [Ferrovum sp.]
MQRSIFWFIVASLLGSAPLVQALEMNAPVPAYTLNLEGGGRVTAQSERGHVTLLHFWASWCVPCREEMPRLEKLYQKYHARGLDIIAIDMDSSEDQPMARDMMKNYHFPWVLKNHAEVDEFGRIWRMPLSILVDRKGIVRQNAWAADDDHGLPESVLLAGIEPLLGPTSAPVSESAVQAAHTPIIQILHPMARATAPGQEEGVVYLTLVNPGDREDALEGADSAVAGHIMLHQTMEMEGDMAHMEHEYHLVIPAHGQVTLAPGGHHLMLEDLDHPLVAGQTVPLDLHFQHSAPVHVDVPITPLVP